MDFERGELARAGQKAGLGFIETQNRNPEQAFRFRVLQGEILDWQGKPNDALALLAAEPSASLANSETGLRRLIVIGSADYLARRFDDAAKILAQAEHISSSRFPSLLADVTMAQATLATYNRNYETAETLNLRTLDIARREKRRYLEAMALGSLGFMALRQQHCGTAIDWFTPSLAISQELGNRTLSAKTLGNLGWCYFKLGDYERAASMFQEAEELSSQLGLAKDQFLWLTNIGSVHYEERDYNGAAEYYQQALSMARKLDNKPGAAACLSNLATTALAIKHYDDAEGFNREALALKRSLGDSEEELSSLLNEARIAAGRKQYAPATVLLRKIIASSGDNLSLRWETESQLADTLALSGNNSAAESEFKVALATIDKARASLTKEEHRLSFLESADRFYNDYIDFLVSRGHKLEALAVTEHSRARTLAEGLKLPLDQTSEKEFNPVGTAKRLNEVILSYWLKPERSYLWVATASHLALFTLPAGDEIEKEARAYRKVLLGPRDPRETADAGAAALYHSLVEPAQKLIPEGARVVVIGNGALNTLNLSTLLVPNPQLHYWIEDVAVSNASSIRLLSGASHDKSATRRALLLIGNPVYNDAEYSELKQAQREMKQVSQHFPADRRTILEGSQATPAAYSASAPGRFSYIHFVAHGTASRTSPLDSSIILSPQSHQWKLYARDIMKEPLHAELVTISACYGAGSRSYSGEGLVGLSWAFLRAGAHNVIAALWEVSDNSTPQLMDAMYGKLADSQDPVTALREAQLTMLRSDTVYRRPFYWGAFQVYSGQL